MDTFGRLDRYVSRRINHGFGEHYPFPLKSFGKKNPSISTSDINLRQDPGIPHDGCD